MALNDNRAVRLSPDEHEVTDVKITRKGLGFLGWFDRHVARLCRIKLSQKFSAAFECCARADEISHVEPALRTDTLHEFLRFGDYRPRIEELLIRQDHTREVYASNAVQVKSFLLIGTRPASWHTLPNRNGWTPSEFTERAPSSILAVDTSGFPPFGRRREDFLVRDTDLRERISYCPFRRSERTFARAGRAARRWFKWRIAHRHLFQTRIERKPLAQSLLHRCRVGVRDVAELDERLRAKKIGGVL